MSFFFFFSPLHSVYSMKIKTIRIKESLRRNRIAHLLPTVPIPYPCRRLLHRPKWPRIDSRSFLLYERDSLILPICYRIKHRIVFYCKKKKKKFSSFFSSIVKIGSIIKYPIRNIKYLLDIFVSICLQGLTLFKIIVR